MMYSIWGWVMEYNARVLSLGYVLSEDHQNVLMLYHTADPNHLSYGKYNGYSDFLRHNESNLDCFKRSVFECTGTTAFDIVFRGSVHWSNFQQQDKSFFAQIFVARINPQRVQLQNVYGENRWLTVEEVLRGDVPLWDGDRQILPIVFDDVSTPFHGVMTYDQGMPQHWFYARA